MKRWKCPLCNAGKIAPGRPRKDDSRTYCFPCSEDTGRLVRRVCPSADREREKRAAAEQKTRERNKAANKRMRAEKRTRVAARRPARGWEVSDAARARLSELGVDVISEAKAMWTAIMATGYQDCRVFPLVKVHTSSYGGSSGRAWSGEIFVRVPTEDSKRRSVNAREDFLETLLHELCHVARGRVDGEHHDQRFRGMLARSAAQYFGIPVVPTRGKKYDTDRRIEEALHEKREGPHDKTN